MEDAYTDDHKSIEKRLPIDSGCDGGALNQQEQVTGVLVICVQRGVLESRPHHWNGGLTGQHGREP
eukprot:2477185-Amphidinium_carterae.1